MKMFGQMIFYTVFMAVLGLFSVWPEFRLSADDEAVVSISFSHVGQRMGDCRVVTQEELSALPPNMRKPADCPRGRHPVRVEFRVDDEVLYSQTLQPSGFWSDGKAVAYKRITIKSGEHRLQISLDDTGSSSGFTSTASP